MKSLLVVAHGSRRETSNEEIRQLTRDLREKAGDRFDRIDCAFLELAEPSIPEGIERCIRQGATSVTVFPYFLSAGRHVASDIPTEVEQTAALHPEVAIVIAPYLGAAANITDVILDQAANPPAEPALG